MARNRIEWAALPALFALLLYTLASRTGAQTPSPIGMFEDHADVGTVLHPGSVEYNAEKHSYVVSGSGENVWTTADAFQFVWKRASGDATLAADISFLAPGGSVHKKALLMIRQSLDPDAAYADAAVHGNGLASLQYREEKGGTTFEIQSNVSAPKRVRIEKRGDYVSISVAGDDGVLHPAGGETRLTIDGPYYIGIGVCSHDKDAIEKVEFSNVELSQPTLYSTLEVVDIATGMRHVAYTAPEHFEAPNWTHDGKEFLINENGHIERLPVTGGKLEIVDTGSATHCNNDHGISPDGTLLAIGDFSPELHGSLVYIVPMGGGTPRRITANAPSYWHGWSPDGKTLAFVGLRNGDFNIYSIPAAGGEETPVTTGKGPDDGPEYSPDGSYIYFNSARTGKMQIWRMRPDGTNQEQVFSDDFNNWFPHISPDGKWMVFLSYEKDVTGHPENKDVTLRLMSLNDKKIIILAKLFGGQGTINVPSWSPDSKQVAFVSYQLH